MFPHTVDQMAAARWVVARLRANISANTIIQDVSAARLAALRNLPVYRQALEGNILKDVLTAARKLQGPAALMKGATPMTLEEYNVLVARGSLCCRQALVLCWLRAARTADVLALRAGSLWREGNQLCIELGSEKAKNLGIPGFVTVALPPREALLLAPLIASRPPLTAPSKRPPLLPLTYDQFRSYILTNRPSNSTITPHSMRKGAVLRMLQAGRSLRDISLVTQHRSVAGLMAYVTCLDSHTKARMVSASTAIAGPTS